eukprot:scaffold2504_cov89-Isochrysis_galbana.AAC.1
MDETLSSASPFRTSPAAFRSTLLSILSTVCTPALAPDSSLPSPCDTLLGQNGWRGTGTTWERPGPKIGASTAAISSPVGRTIAPPPAPRGAGLCMRSVMNISISRRARTRKIAVITIMPMKEAQNRGEPGGRWLSEKVARPEKGARPTSSGSDGAAGAKGSPGARGGSGGTAGGNGGGGGGAGSMSVPRYTLAA